MSATLKELILQLTSCLEEVGDDARVVMHIDSQDTMYAITHLTMAGNSQTKEVMVLLKGFSSREAFLRSIESLDKNNPQ